MWRVLFNILRFNHFAPDILRYPTDESISQYLEREGYPQAFQDDFLIPLCAGIWSAPLGEFSLKFPAETVVRYMWNHGLLRASGQPSQWLSIKGGSRVYIEKLMEKIEKGTACTSMPVTGFREDAERKYVLRFESGEEKVYDSIIFATHADVTRRILGDAATEQEARILESFEYSNNEVVLHSDTSVSPTFIHHSPLTTYLARSNAFTILFFFILSLPPFTLWYHSPF